MFKKGDRVVIVEDCRLNVEKDCRGVAGVVHNVCTIDDEVEVIFDSPMGGHTLNGRCKRGHGWYFYNSDEDELNRDYLTIRKLKKKNNYW